MWRLVLKNIGRNRLRTVLTAGGVAILAASYTVVSAGLSYVQDLVSAASSETRLIVKEKWVYPGSIPARFVPRLAQLDGVVDWTPWCYSVGSVGDRRGTLLIATRPDNVVAMQPGLEALPPSAIARFQSTESAALVGGGLARVHGFGVGQRFTYFTTAGIGVELTVAGIVPTGNRWDHVIFAREDYFRGQTSLEDVVHFVWLKAADIQGARRLRAQVRETFAAQSPALIAESEASSTARVASRYRGVLLLMRSVSAILLCDLLLLFAGTAAISVQQRRAELAVMRAVGFTRRRLLLVIVAEASLVAFCAAALGVGLVYAVSVAAGGLSLAGNVYLAEIRVPAGSVPHGVLVGWFAGTLGSVLPVWNACRRSPAGVLSGR